MSRPVTIEVTFHTCNMAKTQTRKKKLCTEIKNQRRKEESSLVGGGGGGATTLLPMPMYKAQTIHFAYSVQVEVLGGGFWASGKWLAGERRRGVERGEWQCLCLV